MTYQIIWEPGATNAALRFLKEDPAGADVYEAVDALAEDPKPEGSVPYGSVNLRRLYVGDFRLFYAIEEDVIRILVTHLGRRPD
ncbi:type II toxin-antitoxin system RelE/ParE family toxin [Streptomyces triticagri]|uniref:Type II toxin-antitoxin system RelE/ParE family toxin n=1 Tax=Streptomyces triticagri TaxID=2293568 RepID=A0A372M5T0_9ACTN|nr:type II toxin-antitoxin system RelE/ParE family toxin [Streptomyces triticagri]RFU85895.1 type II toxin-antitoxin system RelE/ParE family toxin [Streptomyces triticagri]